MSPSARASMKGQAREKAEHSGHCGAIRAAADNSRTEGHTQTSEMLPGCGDRSSSLNPSSQ